MPNKHSHALVFSHHEYRGLINCDRPQASWAGASRSIKPTDRSPRSYAQFIRWNHSAPQSKPSNRLRIDSSDDPPSRALPPPLLRNSSSAKTQIYASKDLPSRPPPQDPQTSSNSETRFPPPRQRSPSIHREEDNSIPSIETQIYDLQPPKSPTSPTNWQSSSEVKAQRRASQVSSPNGSRPGSRDKDPLRPQSSISPTNWQSSSEVKAQRRASQVSSPKGSRPGSRDKWPKRPGRNTPQLPSLTHVPHEGAPTEAQPSIPISPPSPPATSDSGKSFGLETHLDRLDKTKSTAALTSKSHKSIDLEPHLDRLEKRRSQAAATPESAQSFSLETQLGHLEETKSPPPVPDRTPRRTPPKSSPNSQRSRSPASQPQPDPIKPKTVKPVHSHNFSMSTESSSRQSARSPTLVFQPELMRPNTSRSLQSTFSMTTQLSSRLSGTAQPRSEPIKPTKPITSNSLHFPNFSISTQSSSGQPPTSPNLQFHHEPLRPRTSNGHHSPSFSITTQTSSLNATTFPPVLSRTSSTSSMALVDDDADLESLPSTILDLDIIPRENVNSGPAVFRHAPPVEERPMPSRSSSFDSAIPPPIRHVPNSPTPQDKPLPRTPKPPSTPKKSRKSISSMLFSRPQAPTKAILYSETVPGKLPTPISVSRTGASSISAFFLTYRGQFPTPQKSEERIGRQMSQTSTEARARLGRGVSQSAAEKRRSWFRNEQVDRAFGFGQPVKQRAIEDILRANMYVS